jgi:hypothetical protein
MLSPQRGLKRFAMKEGAQGRQTKRFILLRPEGVKI